MLFFWNIKSFEEIITLLFLFFHIEEAPLSKEECVSSRILYKLLNNKGISFISKMEFFQFDKVGLKSLIVDGTSIEFSFERTEFSYLFCIFAFFAFLVD